MTKQLAAWEVNIVNHLFRCLITLAVFYAGSYSACLQATSTSLIIDLQSKNRALKLQGSRSPEEIIYQPGVTIGNKWRGASMKREKQKSSSELILAMHKIGSYYVPVNSNSGENIKAGDFVVAGVSGALRIISQPKDSRIISGGKIRAAVNVIGPGGLFTYEWRKVNSNGSDELYYLDKDSSAKRAHLEFRAGTYYVVIRNNIGNRVRSNVFVILDAKSSLEILSQPKSGQVASGDKLTAKVGITGPGDSFTYEWRQIRDNGSDVLFFLDKDSSARKAALDFLAGTYYVVIENNLGDSVRSNVFTISAWEEKNTIITSRLKPISSGKTFYVSKTGSDSNNCLSKNSACKTIQSAIDKITGGDKLVILQGTYYETPKFNNLGSSSAKPIWVLAKPRGEVRISGVWKPAVLAQVAWRNDGNGIYSTPYVSNAAPLFAHYKNIFLPRYLSVSDLMASRANYIKENKNVVMRALHYGYALKAGRLYVRLPRTINDINGTIITSCPVDTKNPICESNQNLPAINPNGKSIEFSTATWENGNSPKPLITISGSPYMIFDGFKLEGSGTFCLAFSQDSIAPTIRNTVFENCRYGARLPDDSLVEWSEYSYRGFNHFSDQLKAVNADGHYKTYHFAKDYLRAWWEGGLADTFGKAGASKNCEFHHNYLHHAFDGESLGDFQYSESHHNVYETNYDDHIEMEAWASGNQSRELRLHHNLFLSRGRISHQGDNIIGPHYVYRNVFYYDDIEEPGFTVIKSKAPNAARGINYFHNLIWTTESTLYWESPLTLKHLKFRNNIFVFNDNWNKPVSGHPINADYNIFVSSYDKAWLRGSHGKYLGSTPNNIGFKDLANLDFNINKQSPAANAGVLISGFHNNSTFNEAISAGVAPDIGPIESGRDETGSNWPRPRSTVFNTDAPSRW
jgi:hypothetical protein